MTGDGEEGVEYDDGRCNGRLRGCSRLGEGQTAARSMRDVDTKTHNKTRPGGQDS